MAVTKEDKKKKLGWTLSLRASPRKGFSKDAEELAGITKGRHKLLVTKEADLRESGKVLSLGDHADKGVMAGKGKLQGTRKQWR